MSVPSGAAAGILLVVVGIWLLVQTLAAGLVDRILALRAPAASSTSPSAPSTSPAAK